MSYLKNYAKKVKSPETTNSSKRELEITKGIQTTKKEGNVIQVKFTGLKLDFFSAQSVINSLSDQVEAIDLSNNKIETLPQSIPSSLLGMNLSYNNILQIQVSKRLINLIELNLSHNSIIQTNELLILTNIQFLDLSFNQISCIDGLENMKALKVLNVSNNLIDSYTNLHPLAYNIVLEELNLLENPISNHKQLKFHLLNLIPTIKILNKAPIRQRSTTYFEQQDKRMVYHALQTPNTKDDRSDSAWSNALSGGALEHILHAGMSPSMILQEEQIEEEEQPVEIQTPIELSNKKKSKLPWRNPPNPPIRPMTKNLVERNRKIASPKKESHEDLIAKKKSHHNLPPPPPLPDLSMMGGSVSSDESDNLDQASLRINQNTWLAPHLNGKQVKQFEEQKLIKLPPDWEVRFSPFRGRPTHKHQSSSNPTSRTPSPTRSSTLRELYTNVKLEHSAHNEAVELANQLAKSPYTLPYRPSAPTRQRVSPKESEVPKGYIERYGPVLAPPLPEETRNEDPSNNEFMSPYKRLLAMRQKLNQSQEIVPNNSTIDPYTNPRDRTLSLQDIIDSDLHDPLGENETHSSNTSTFEQVPEGSSYQLYNDLVRRRKEIMENLSVELSNQGLLALLPEYIQRSETKTSQNVVVSQPNVTPIEPQSILSETMRLSQTIAELKAKKMKELSQISTEFQYNNPDTISSRNVLEEKYQAPPPPPPTMRHKPTPMSFANTVTVEDVEESDDNITLEIENQSFDNLPSNPPISNKNNTNVSQEAQDIKQAMDSLRQRQISSLNRLQSNRYNQ